jgi:hypothetical protein
MSRRENGDIYYTFLTMEYVMNTLPMDKRNCDSKAKTIISAKSGQPNDIRILPGPLCAEKLRQLANDRLRHFMNYR